MSTTIPRSIVLNVCAAGHGVTLQGHTLPLVCGRPPGHKPPHRDACWPVEWHDTPDAAVTPAPVVPGNPRPRTEASPPLIPSQRTGSVNPMPP